MPEVTRRVYFLFLGTLTLGVLIYYVRNMTTLRLLCFEEAEASHMERQQEETPMLANPMLASCSSYPIPVSKYVS